MAPNREVSKPYAGGSDNAPLKVQRSPLRR